jgi:hypothetical protein
LLPLPGVVEWRDQTLRTDELTVKLTGKKGRDKRGVCGAKNASRDKPTADYRVQVM